MRIDNFTMPIPALASTAHIHIYVPDVYEEGKRLPVFYMNDGQGIFYDDLNANETGMQFAAYAKEMERYLPDVIIVAVEAPATRFERMQRYLPAWNYSESLNAVYGADFACHGIEYARWMAYDLKQRIDQTYHTFPASQHTALGGLSASCILASYATGRYPQVYSKLLILSPSVYLWWEALKPLYQTLDYHHLDAVFSYVGTNETGRITQADHFQKGSQMLEEMMLYKGLSSEALKHITHPGGEHTYVGWKYFFLEGLRWIYRSLA